MLSIRNVLISDLDDVSEIEGICFPKAEAATKEIFNERINVYAKCFFVIEEDSNIIGFVNGGATNENHIRDEFFATMDLHIDSGDNLVVFGLDVLPDYQRKGLAKKLMKHFINEAKNNNKKKILLTCKEHLIHYYEKFGYINECVSESEHGNAKWYDMSLEIS